jgi:hypothetical protein
MPKIASPVVQPPERQMFSIHFLGLRDTAEVAESRTACLSRRETLPDIFLGGLLEMTGNLLAQVLVDVSPVNQPEQARQKDAPLAHDASS